MVEYFFRRAFAYSLDILLIALLVDLVCTSKVNFQMEKYNDTYNEYFSMYEEYNQHSKIEKIDSCDKLMEYINKEELVLEKYVDQYEEIKSLKNDEETKEEFDLKCNKIVEEYNSFDVTDEEYNTLVRKYNRTLEKNSVLYYVLTIVLSFLYFVLFQGFTGGQTLGKKFMRVKVVSKDLEKDVSYKQLFFRTLFLNSVVYSIFMLIGAYVLNDLVFTVFANILTLVDTLVLGILIVTSCFNKDRRGLHDTLLATRVVVVDFKGNIIGVDSVEENVEELSEIEPKKEVKKKIRKSKKDN